MTGRIPSRGADQFNLRLPDGMRDRLRGAAEANGRSMNAEIVARLEDSLREGPHSLMADAQKTTELGMLTMLNFVELILEGDTTGKALKEISAKFRDNVRKNFPETDFLNKHLDIDPMKEKMRDYKNTKLQSNLKKPD